MYICEDDGSAFWVDGRNDVDFLEILTSDSPGDILDISLTSLLHSLSALVRRGKLNHVIHGRRF